MIDEELFDAERNAPKENFLRYSREKRLKNASWKVRQLYDPNFIKKKGFLKSLTSNRGFSAVFFVIVILVVINLILFFIRSDRSAGRIYGIKTELNSFFYQDKILANIRLHGKEYFVSDETVRVQFIFFDKDKNKIGAFLSEGVYSGTELRFSASDNSGTASTVQADIFLKDRLLTLKQTIK